MSNSKTASVLARTATVIRDAWLVFGISLALFLMMELAYRGQGTVRRAISSASSSTPEQPQANNSWIDEYLREQESSNRLQWKPYVYFRRLPFEGLFINVDQRGRRRTVQPRSCDRDPDEIFLFGGSTMFGSYQRDDATIPSLVTKELSETAPCQFKAVNFGETGYVFTQEVIELMLQLRSGARLRLVVFYDGINDVAAAAQAGMAGIP